MFIEKLIHSEKFKTFRLFDLLSFGGFAMIPTLATAYAYAHDVRGEALYLLLTVTAMFWFIYGYIVYWRSKFVKNISFITKHKIAVFANEFQINQSEFEAVVDDTIEKWAKATNQDTESCSKALEMLFVSFHAMPVKLHSKPNELFAGVLIGDMAVVGWKEELNKTALAHELGHKIHWVWTGAADNDGCHNFMVDHKLV